MKLFWLLFWTLNSMGWMAHLVATQEPWSAIIMVLCVIASVLEARRLHLEQTDA